jgi:hypothetical protein
MLVEVLARQVASLSCSVSSALGCGHANAKFNLKLQLAMDSTDSVTSDSGCRHSQCLTCGEITSLKSLTTNGVPVYTAAEDQPVSPDVYVRRSPE